MTYNTSEVQIGANALRLLGDDPITSLDDDTERARLVKALLPEARRETIAGHPWNCSTERATFARSETAPVWGYAYAYQIPTGVLRIFEVQYEKDYPWKREGDKVVTDNGACRARYAVDVEDPNLWDPGMAKAVTYALAVKLAIPVTGKTTTMDKMVALWVDAMSSARTYDGQEGTPDTIEASVLIDARIS